MHPEYGPMRLAVRDALMAKARTLSRRTAEPMGNALSTSEGDHIAPRKRGKSMPTTPPENERAENAPPIMQAPKSPSQLERSRLGGTQPRSKRAEDDAPFSRSDLRKSAQEPAEGGTARINWSVLVVSSIVILAFSVWAIFMPEGARTTMKSVVDWIATNLGWYYVLTMALVIGFVVWVALSKEGRVQQRHRCLLPAGGFHTSWFGRLRPDGPDTAAGD